MVKIKCKKGVVSVKGGRDIIMVAVFKDGKPITDKCPMLKAWVDGEAYAEIPLCSYHKVDEIIKWANGEM